MTERERIGVREYGRRVGVSHVAVLNAIKAGRLNKSVTRDARGRPRIDPVAADREWGHNTDSDKNRNTEKKGGRDPAPPPKGQGALFSDVVPPAAASGTTFGGKTVTEWRAASMAVELENKKLDLDQRKGRLVDVGKVRAAWFQLVRDTRDRLLMIPDRLAGEIAAESDMRRVHAMLDRELREALQELTTDGDQASRDTA